jgi:hypothetical protein
MSPPSNSPVLLEDGLSGGRIDKINLNEEGVPGVDEVDSDIVPGLKVTVQSKESLEGRQRRRDR